MAPKPTLPDCGYLVAYLGLSPETLNALLDEAKTRTYTPVFKDVSDDSHDTYREQSRVQARSPSIGLLRVAISAVTACLDPAWLPTVFSFLRSTPGGEEQEAHQDYPESVITEASKNKSTRAPASMVLALEEGTSLRVYDGCFTARDDSKSRVVQIPVGFCIIFRGDLIHNGMPYDVVNHRIHCYQSFRGLKWEPDVVNSVLPKTYSCQYCGIKYGDSAAMRSHRRFCTMNPEAAKNEATRHRTDNKEGEWTCPLCLKTFAKSGSLRSHTFRGCTKKRKAD